MLACDTVIIGSGAGGLAAAVALARAGERVLVLEQHYLPGGWCHSFHLDRYRFSPGVHYVGQLHPGGSLRAIYEGLGVASDLTFFEIDPKGYDHCQLAGVRFDYPKGKEPLADALKAQFPSEARGIDDYVDLVEKVCAGLNDLFNAHGFWDTVRLPYRMRYVGRYGGYSLERILRDRISDPALRSILGVQCGDHGLTPAQATFGLHAAVQGHYFGGAFYPRGGGATIARAMCRALKRHGGEIKLQARVEKIMVEGRGGQRRAIGVRLADGTEIRARRVVSNADPLVTFRHLLDEDQISSGLRKKLDRTRWSASALSLFLAVDADLKNMGFNSGNNWYSDSLDHEETYRNLMSADVFERDRFPGIFVNVTTMKDPTAFDGRHHTIEAFTFVPYDPFARWEGLPPDRRPPDYESFKERLTGTFLRTLDHYAPGLSRQVVFQAIGTPATNHYYVNATQGNAYGTEKSLKQLGPFAFKLRSEIPGLYLCGASTLSHGISGATTSGLMLAAELLDCRPTELLTEKGSTLHTYLADDSTDWPESLRSSRSRRAAAASTGTATMLIDPPSSG
jgi:all-trans-retinol 13,14-reductase